VVDPIVILFIAIAGGIGSVIRLILGSWRGRMPWGVLMANILAGLILGFLQVASHRNAIDATLSGVVYLGLCGGISTFSAVAADTGDYLRDGQLGKALANAMANLVLPVVALWLPVMFLVVLVN
jgi:CrcB protein